MIHWIKNILGRWQEQRIRTKAIRENYRIIAQNLATLNGSDTL